MSALARLRIAGLVLAGGVYWLDQWIKNQVRWALNLPEVGTIEILPFFNLHWTQNYGVSLGMLTADSIEMRALLIAITSAIALGVLAWLLWEKTWPEIVGLAMVLGGAAGNIRDRMRYGYVVDYADLHFGEFRPFLVFNLADAAITLGILIVLARSFLSREKRDPQDANKISAAAADASES